MRNCNAKVSSACKGSLTTISWQRELHQKSPKAEGSRGGAHQMLKLQLQADCEHEGRVITRANHPESDRLLETSLDEAIGFLPCLS